MTFSLQILNFRRWRRLSQLYSAPGRHYHTLKHIYQMLCFFEEFRHFVKDPQCVQFAIWFHEYVFFDTL
jgi:predicted metal-dependent HD superfamily phosphohydrolase